VKPTFETSDISNIVLRQALHNIKRNTGVINILSKSFRVLYLLYSTSNLILMWFRSNIPMLGHQVQNILPFLTKFSEQKPRPGQPLAGAQVTI
jgi:hypothetical protein